MTSTWIVIAFAASLLQERPVDLPAAAAQGPAKQRVAALRKEYDDARSSFEERYAAATDDAARQLVMEQALPKPDAYVPRFFSLAAELKSDPAALDCLTWVLQHSTAAPDVARACDALVADHLASPGLGPAIESFGSFSRTLAAERFLRTVAEKSPHWDVKGLATCKLALVLTGLAKLCDLVQSPEFTPKVAEMNAAFYGKEMLEELAARDPEEMRAEAEDLFETVVAEFKSVKTAQGSLAAQAETELFELRNLAIGKVAPEIVGPDVDAVPFKLSDYRGKIVVLDFWGFW